MIDITAVRFATCALAMCCPAGFAAAESVTLNPSKDNTIIEQPSGALSNALGDGIHCGRTGSLGGGMRLRAILAFDLAGSLPAGADIQSATLTLTVVQAPNENPHTHTVHRALANWGEATSQGTGGQGAKATVGDVTWLHTFYPDQFWKNAGGDYQASPSASQLIAFDSLPHVVNISSPGLLADVQAWHADPKSNFGWIILGNEEIWQTSRKFASREHEVEAFRPQLTIVYAPGGTCAADIAPAGGDGSVNVDDLLAIINSWGACEGDCTADIAPQGGNGSVDVDDLLLVINSWGACD